MRTTLVLVSAATLAFAACGGKSLKQFTPTQSDKDSALTVVNNTQALSALKTNAADSNALGGLGQVMAGAQQLSASGQAHKSGALSLDGQKADGFDTCVTTSGGTTTYNNCVSGDETINGTIGINGDSISCDLSIALSSGGYTVSYSGSVAVTPTLVNGSLSFDYDMSSVNYSVDVTYDNLVLDAACELGPTSGSMTVDVSTKIQGLSGIPGASGSSSTTVRVDFGPACGDMAMFAG